MHHTQCRYLPYPNCSIGILHVDYESLIPYLSESMKQNYRDLQNMTSEVQQIKRALDTLYEQYTNKNNINHEEKSARANIRNKLLGWVVGIVTLSMIVSMTIVWIFFTDANTLPIHPIGDLSPIDFERNVLEAFYRSMVPKYWQLKWNFTDPHCTWKGITCNSTTGRVTAIEMAFFGLFTSFNGSTIPASLGNFTELRSLELASNFLTSTIPESIRNLKNLEYLGLSMNQLFGTVPDLSGLPKIRSVNIHDNNLNGSLTMLMQLPSIRSIIAYDNPFDCELPQIISQSLSEISIFSGRIRGTIPASWTSSNLTVVDLKSNLLNGSVPCLGSRIVKLNLAYNYLTGDFCGSSLKHIQQLSLSGNNLTGVFDLPHVNTTGIRLMIDSNQFTSFMPSALNSTTENVPSLCTANNNPFKCPIPSWASVICSAKC